MAISVSNPTTATGRKTLGEVAQGLASYRRQDLQYLKELASLSGARLPMSALEKPDESHVRTLRDLHAKLLERVPNATVTEHEWPLEKHPDMSVPVCNLRYDGAPVRPVGLKCKGNAVLTSRAFGGGKTPVEELRALLAGLGYEHVHQAVQSKIYTRGTIEGFEKRLKLLVGKTTRSILKSPGFPSQRKGQMALLERLLPVDVEQLPDWSGGEGGDLIAMLESHVKITARASAGAPYWRPKGEVLPVVYAVLESCLEHLKEGKLDQLLKEQPELFLIECKNKEDRYDVEKLGDKTRPYFNPPAHWNLLASFLHQAISHALYKVGGDKDTWNAYGWSAAHGGITRLVEEVKSRHKRGERGWGYVYGDDGDLYFGVGKNLYRVSPDIKQMDSCVDFDTIRLTYRYILHCFEKRWGPSPFWETVVEALLSMLEKPRILVSGTQLYTKPPDGLLSGVVGTTFFDTVKSAVAYASLLDAFIDNPAALLRSDTVSKWLLDNHGLVVKEGTWEPQLMNLEPEPAYMDPQGNVDDVSSSIYGEGKFLGVQYVLVGGPNGADWMPYLPIQDWASAILAPRDATFGEQMSATARQRLQFDRIRGYLTTGAAMSRHVRNSLYYWLDRLPGEVILMQPQGTTPPEGVLFGEEGGDWEYPAPEFVPDPHWVYDLYASEGNRWNKSRLQYFSDYVLEQVEAQRKERRKIRIALRGDKTVVEAWVPDKIEKPQILPALKEKMPVKLTSHWHGETPKRAQVREERAGLPVDGIPYDLALEQTEAEAKSLAKKQKPSDSILHQIVDPENLKPLTVVSASVGGSKIEVPPSMIAKETEPPLVHPPTVGGYLPPVVGVAPLAVLVQSSFPALHYVDIADTSYTPERAAEYIMAKNGLVWKWKFEMSHKVEGERSDRISKAVVLGSLRFLPVREHEFDKCRINSAPIVQMWTGPSQRVIKSAYWAWLLRANKEKAQGVLKEQAVKNWALSVERSVIPYSEVKGEPVGPPKPEFKSPYFPVTIPYETVAGEVAVAGLEREPIKVLLPEPTPADEVEAPVVESVVPFADATESEILPVIKAKSPNLFKVRPRKWWMREEEEVYGYQNVYFDPKKEVFVVRPAGDGDKPPIGPKPRRSVKIESKGVVTPKQVSKATSREALAGPSKAKPDLPEAPAGGWPYYLVCPYSDVREEDRTKREAFTAQYGRLPKRTTEGLPEKPSEGWPRYLLQPLKDVAEKDKPLREEFIQRYGKLPPKTRAISRMLKAEAVKTPPELEKGEELTLRKIPEPARASGQPTSYSDMTKDQLISILVQHGKKEIKIQGDAGHPGGASNQSKTPQKGSQAKKSGPPNGSAGSHWDYSPWTPRARYQGARDRPARGVHRDKRQDWHRGSSGRESRAVPENGTAR